MKLTDEWVVGFVDGEGCFHVSVNSQSEMTTGFQVLPEFVVVQHTRDQQILYALKRFFGAGVVRSNHGDRDCLRIRQLDALARVCEFFMAHSLKTKKNVDFRRFRRIILLMQDGAHLKSEGIVEIIRIACEMNSTNRPALAGVLQKLNASG